MANRNIIDIKIRVDTGDSPDRVGGLSDSVSSLIKNIGGLAAAYLSFEGLSKAVQSVVNTGKEFEMTMARVGSIAYDTGLSAKENADNFEMLSAAARKAGAETEWSATQAAGGLKFMVAAGFSAKEAVAGLPDMLNLATAAEIDLEKAADIATGTLGGFGLEVKDLAHLNDVLAATANKTNAGMEDMAYALKYSAPYARQMGVEVEQVSAMLGVLAKANIKGTDAGTDLTQIFIKLGGVAKDFGLKGNDVAGVLERIKKEQWDVTKTAKAFGSENAKSVLQLANNVEWLKTLSGELKTVDGDAKRVADAVRNTLGGAFNNLSSTIESTALDIFDRYKESIKNAVIETTEFIRQHGDTILLMVDAAIKFGEVALAGGVFYAAVVGIPALMTAAETATMAFNMSLLSAQASAALLGGFLSTTLIAALSVAIAAFAGWKVGEWLYENFAVARDAGLSFVSYIMRGWIEVRAGAEIAWAGITTAINNALAYGGKLFQAFVQNVAGMLGKIPGMEGFASDLAFNASRIQALNKPVKDLGTTIDGVMAKRDRELSQHKANVAAIAQEHDAFRKQKEALQATGKEEEAYQKAVAKSAGAVKDKGVAVNEVGKDIKNTHAAVTKSHNTELDRQKQKAEQHEKEMQAIRDRFAEEYAKTTLSSHDYELKKLDEKVAEWEKASVDKTQIQMAFDAQYFDILEKETQKVKQEEEKKRAENLKTLREKYKYDIPGFVEAGEAVGASDSFMGMKAAAERAKEVESDVTAHEEKELEKRQDLISSFMADAGSLWDDYYTEQATAADEYADGYQRIQDEYTKAVEERVKEEQELEESKYERLAALEKDYQASQAELSKEFSGIFAGEFAKDGDVTGFIESIYAFQDKKLSVEEEYAQKRAELAEDILAEEKALADRRLEVEKEYQDSLTALNEEYDTKKTELMDSAYSEWDSLLSKMSSSFGGFLGGLNSGLNAALSNLNSGGGSGKSGGLISGLWGTVSGWFGGGSGGSGIWNTVSNLFSGDGALGSIGKWVSGAWDTVSTWGGKAWDTVSTWGGKAWSTVKDWAGTAWNTVSTWGNKAIDAVQNIQTAAGLTQTASAAGSATGAVSSGLGSWNIAGGVANVGSQLLSGDLFANKYNNKALGVIQTIGAFTKYGGILGTLGEWLGGLFNDTAAQVGAGIGGGAGIGASIGSIGGPVGSAVGAVIGAVVGGIASLFGSKGEVREGLEQQVVGFFEDSRGKIVSSDFNEGGDEGFSQALTEIVSGAQTRAWDVVNGVMAVMPEKYAETMREKLEAASVTVSEDAENKAWKIRGEHVEEDMTHVYLAMTDRMYETAIPAMEETAKQMTDGINLGLVTGNQRLAELSDFLAKGVEYTKPENWFHDDTMKANIEAVEKYAQALAEYSAIVDSMTADVWNSISDTLESYGVSMNDVEIKSVDTEKQSAYSIALEEINTQFDTWIQTLRQLGVAESELAELEKKRPELLAKIEEQFKQAREAAIVQFGSKYGVSTEGMIKGGTSYSAAFDGLNKDILALEDNLFELGYSAEEAAEKTRLLGDAAKANLTKQFEDARKAAIGEFGSKYGLKTVMPSSYEKAFAELRQDTKTLELALTDLGMSADDAAKEARRLGKAAEESLEKTFKDARKNLTDAFKNEYKLGGESEYNAAFKKLDADLATLETAFLDTGMSAMQAKVETAKLGQAAREQLAKEFKDARTAILDNAKALTGLDKNAKSFTAAAKTVNTQFSEMQRQMENAGATAAELAQMETYRMQAVQEAQRQLVFPEINSDAIASLFSSAISAAAEKVKLGEDVNFTELGNQINARIQDAFRISIVNFGIGQVSDYINQNMLMPLMNDIIAGFSGDGFNLEQIQASFSKIQGLDLANLSAGLTELFTAMATGQAIDWTVFAQKYGAGFQEIAEGMMSEEPPEIDVNAPVYVLPEEYDTTVAVASPDYAAATEASEGYIQSVGKQKDAVITADGSISDMTAAADDMASTVNTAESSLISFGYAAEDFADNLSAAAAQISALSVNDTAASHASGLWHVPRNEYPARLHLGEGVIRREDMPLVRNVLSATGRSGKYGVAPALGKDGVPSFAGGSLGVWDTGNWFADTGGSGGSGGSGDSGGADDLAAAKEALPGILENIALILGVMSEYDKALKDTKAEWEETIATMTKAGATTEQLAAATAAMNAELETLEAEYKATRAEILTTAQGLAGIVPDELTQTIADVNSQFDDLITQYAAAGASAEELAGLEALRAEAVEYQTEVIKDAREAEQQSREKERKGIIGTVKAMAGMANVNSVMVRYISDTAEELAELGGRMAELGASAEELAEFQGMAAEALTQAAAQGIFGDTESLIAGAFRDAINGAVEQVEINESAIARLNVLMETPLNEMTEEMVEEMNDLKDQLADVDFSEIGGTVAAQIKDALQLSISDLALNQVSANINDALVAPMINAITSGFLTGNFDFEGIQNAIGAVQSLDLTGLSSAIVELFTAIETGQEFDFESFASKFETLGPEFQNLLDLTGGSIDTAGDDVGDAIGDAGDAVTAAGDGIVAAVNATVADIDGSFDLLETTIGALGEIIAAAAAAAAAAADIPAPVATPDTTPDLSAATGLWNVPRSEMLARIHYGEGVIRREDMPLVRNVLKSTGRSGKYGVPAVKNGLPSFEGGLVDWGDITNPYAGFNPDVLSVGGVVTAVDEITAAFQAGADAITDAGGGGEGGGDVPDVSDLIQMIDDIVKGTSEYEIAVRELNATWDQHIADLKAAGASAQVLADAEAARNIQLDELDAEYAARITDITDSISDYMRAYDPFYANMSDYDKTLLEINEKFDAWVLDLKAAGASADELAGVEAFRQQALLFEQQKEADRLHQEALEKQARISESIENTIAGIINSDLNAGLTAETARIQAQEEYERLKAEAGTSEDAMNEFLDYAGTYLQAAQADLKGSAAYMRIYGGVLSDIEAMQLTEPPAAPDVTPVTPVTPVTQIPVSAQTPGAVQTDPEVIDLLEQLAAASETKQNINIIVYLGDEQINVKMAKIADNLDVRHHQNPNLQGRPQVF